MSSPIAESVLAATHKLVQQAMTGQWQDVSKTLAERRQLLDELSASATPHDQPWLAALKQAMAESDEAIATMSAAASTQESAPAAGGVAGADEMLRMIRQSR
jgi:hypothetical protein